MSAVGVAEEVGGLAVHVGAYESGSDLCSRGSLVVVAEFGE
jgi:hypothetical protein